MCVLYTLSSPFSENLKAQTHVRQRDSSSLLSSAGESIEVFLRNGFNGSLPWPELRRRNRIWWLGCWTCWKTMEVQIREGRDANEQSVGFDRERLAASDWGLETNRSLPLVCTLFREATEGKKVGGNILLPHRTTKISKKKITTEKTVLCVIFFFSPYLGELAVMLYISGVESRWSLDDIIMKNVADWLAMTSFVCNLETLFTISFSRKSRWPL